MQIQSFSGSQLFTVCFDFAVLAIPRHNLLNLKLLVDRNERLLAVDQSLDEIFKGRFTESSLQHAVHLLLVAVGNHGWVAASALPEAVFELVLDTSFAPKESKWLALVSLSSLLQNGQQLVSLFLVRVVDMGDESDHAHT